MAGVQGLGQRVLAGTRSPHAQALAADLDHLGMQVTPENVLQIRNVLKAEANRLADVIAVNEFRLHVDLCGGDPVSRNAADGFNAKIKRLLDQCNGYVRALRTAAVALERAAANYGHSEEEIENSFDKFRPEHPAEWSAALTAPSEYSSTASVLRPYLPSPVGPRTPDEWSPLVHSQDRAGGKR